jgi:hypothetical protein
MKAMNLIMQWYYARSKLVESEVLVNAIYNHAKKVKSDEGAFIIREQKISRREKALETTLNIILKMKN